MASSIWLFVSISFTFLYLATSSPPTEAETLLLFKASIDDPKKSLLTWSNTSALHHCNWTGVTCTATATPSSLYVSSLTLQSFNLSGEISASICQLPHLSLLNLADNFFNQPIPLHLSQCTTLETLILTNNLIWGTIPDQISQFQSLKVLDLSKNHVEGKIPDGLGSLLSLRVLNLGSNLLSGTLPSVFENLTQLVRLDLSQNAFLVSRIPDGIGKLDKLEELLLQSCGLYGDIPDSLVGMEKLSVLDLSMNNLTGEIPDSLGSTLKNLNTFDVSQNKISGSFPAGICNGKDLINLSLHTNFFSGTVPTSVSECLKLEKFQIQNNGFSGDFPSGIWSLPQIKLIRAENNKFSGRIPNSISAATQLEQVQIDNNSFTGQMPPGVGLVKSMYRFSASLNNFYGELHPNFCDSPLLSILNLSHNSISGQIPELKKCKKLVSLSLADNSLTGQIPQSLADLPVLTYLDLSDNNLTGSIPQGLQNLKLALFNISFNHLSGRVPYSLISGQPASFLQGNSELCGPGLPNACSSDHQGNRSNGLTTLICTVISIAFVVATLLVAAGFFLFHPYFKSKTRTGIWHSVFFYPLRLTENDLANGMNEKSSAGKEGSFGRVYIVSLPGSGELVAIKKLVNFGNQSSKTLKNEVKTIAKIRHKNVVKVLGFCYSDETVFLIYEFVPKGSLGDLIYQPDFELPWSVRLRIAIGIAQGLTYLHNHYVPHLLHRNLKSKNILLEADFEPKLTDFALDRVLGETAFQSTMASEAANSCYNAPEYNYSKKASENMDVYSFGVVLLELVTGRQAEPSDPEPLDIVKWVRRKINIKNGDVQVLDLKISSSTSVQEEMLEALQIGLQCTSVAPEKRPSMVEVVKALQSISLKNSVTSLEISSSEC